MKPQRAAIARQRLLLALAAAFALLPLLWMLSVSFMQPGAASTLPAAAAAADADAGQLPRSCSRGAGMGRYLLNSLVIALLRSPLISVLFNVMAGYAFAKLRFARARRAVQRCSARW